MLIRSLGDALQCEPRAAKLECHPKSALIFGRIDDHSADEPASAALATATRLEPRFRQNAPNSRADLKTCAYCLTLQRNAFCLSVKSHAHLHKRKPHIVTGDTSNIQRKAARSKLNWRLSTPLWRWRWGSGDWHRVMDLNHCHAGVESAALPD